MKLEDALLLADNGIDFTKPLVRNSIDIQLLNAIVYNSDEHWVTIHGQHIKIGGDGKIEAGGNPNLIKAIAGDTKKGFTKPDIGVRQFKAFDTGKEAIHQGNLKLIAAMSPEHQKEMAQKLGITVGELHTKLAKWAGGDFNKGNLSIESAKIVDDGLKDHPALPATTKKSNPSTPKPSTQPKSPSTPPIPQIGHESPKPSVQSQSPQATGELGTTQHARLVGESLKNVVPGINYIHVSKSGEYSFNPGAINLSVSNEIVGKSPQTIPGHESATGVAIKILPNKKHIKFEEINSKIKGAGTKMVDHIVSSFPGYTFSMTDMSKNTGTDVAKSESFWERMGQRHPARFILK